MYSQSAGNSPDVHQADISLATLDTTDIGPMQASLFCKFLLRVSALDSQRPHMTPKGGLSVHKHGIVESSIEVRLQTMSSIGVQVSKQNDAAGFIQPDGRFLGLGARTHSIHARLMGTQLRRLLKQGWIRKAGQGAYEGKLTDVTLTAVEQDLTMDYEELKGAGRWPAVRAIVLEDPTSNTTLAIPLEVFEESGFNLHNAANRARLRSRNA